MQKSVKENVIAKQCLKLHPGDAELDLTIARTDRAVRVLGRVIGSVLAAALDDASRGDP